MAGFKFILVALFVFLFSGCAVNYKAQLKTLEKCDYTIQSVDNIKIAGKSLASYESDGGVSLSSLPGIAFALLRQDLPLEAQVNLNIANPTTTRSTINAFKYIIEIQGKPIFEGAVDENINLGTGESALIPLTFKANIFGVAKEQGFDRVLSEIFSRQSEGFIALKIKPSVKIGNKNYFYPGYITVDKNFGSGLQKAIEKRL